MVVSEAFLEQLELLRTLIKNNTAGKFGGNHQSRTFGSSCEFADYRDYFPGDDVTKIDWNAFARFEKLYLKLYLDERQAHTRIYIDTSKSMTYGKPKKSEQALKIAAAFAYLSVCEMDKVSVYLIRNGRVEEVFANLLGRESFYNEIGKLDAIQFDGESKISEAILPSAVGYGDGFSLIISDFLTDGDYETAIDHLVSKRRDVVCIQILTKEELSPMARGKMHYIDSENAGRTYRKNITREILRAYAEALNYVTGRIGNYCRSRGGDYLLVSSDEPLNDIFFGKMADMGVVK